jgi:tetratricopeptide (TPR) repeat protein
MRRGGPRIVWAVVLAGAAVLAAGVGWEIARGWSREAADPVRRARALYEGRDWAGAADLVRRRLKADPGDAEALRVLARATARLGRDAAANGLFSRLGAEAMQAEDFYLLGVGLSHNRQTASAQRMWEKALAQDPDHAEALDALARAYAVGSRPDEAARLAERLSRRPGWELRGELIRGALLYELDDPAGSAGILARALRRPEASGLDPSLLARDCKLVARALLRLGKSGEARAWLGRVEGSDPEASWLVSRAALQEGAISEAAVALRSSGSYRDEHRMEPEPGPYAGEARCAECHPEIAAAQGASRHASTLVRGADLAKIPYPAGPISDTDDPSVVHRFRREGDAIRFESEEGGAIRSAVVAYAFGSPDHYVSLVGPSDQGREYILRLSRYATATDSGWVRTTGHSADGPGGRDDLGKPLDGPDALYNCLFCHATTPRAVLDGTGPAARDRAIGCERCHGPGGLHIKAIRARLTDLAIVNPANAPPEGRLRLCGQCHGHHLASASSSSPPRTDPYWIRFQGTTLTWSRCYTESAGALDCMTCHDPHHDSKRTEAEQVAACLNCHAPAPGGDGVGPGPAAGPAGRVTRGASCPINPSRGCIGCHMPPFESAPLHATFTDHFIRVHPGRTARR